MLRDRQTRPDAAVSVTPLSFGLNHRVWYDGAGAD